MSALSIQPTFPIFTETDGLPLENGYIWIGAANLDPTKSGMAPGTYLHTACVQGPFIEIVGVASASMVADNVLWLL